jgi:hypothetical protein
LPSDPEKKRYAKSFQTGDQFFSSSRLQGEQKPMWIWIGSRKQYIEKASQKNKENIALPKVGISAIPWLLISFSAKKSFLESFATYSCPAPSWEDSA